MRLFFQAVHLSTGDRAPMRQVLIYGAGEAGKMVLKEINRHPEENINVLGFIDDDPGKLKKYIYAKRVLGSRNDLPRVINELGVNEVIISMPSIPKTVVKQIVKICKAQKVKLLIVPSTMEIIEGVVKFDQIKRIDLSDLLDREELNIDTERINRYIKGRTVLVTGAAGSIGSMLVEKLLEYQPDRVIALDINENGLFHLLRKLEQNKGRTRLVPCISDIKNEQLLEEVFSAYRPQVIFHAAAYKHVPLMENHPRMIVLNNLKGTYNLLELSTDYGVEKFIGISTDKAVYPVSLMGKTKRVGELLVGAYSHKGLAASSVRFGNVLGSNGSVVTIFNSQVSSGGPITVTSPDMERYFMTVEEASSLVLQAGSMEGNGDVYVLDMGKPIKIKDLAENLIILSGMTPGVDINIDYTGIRSGEKIKEELFYRDARVIQSSYPGIFTEKTSTIDKNLPQKLQLLLSGIYLLPENDIPGAIDEILEAQSVQSAGSRIVV
ncbi:MAG: polysaccharide biosynthesis protein [Spirochaetota bacterium]